jgi:hypothetical protein
MQEVSEDRFRATTTFKRKIIQGDGDKYLTALTARASHLHAIHIHMLTVRHGICWAITKMNDGWPPPPQKVIQVLTKIIQVSDFIQAGLERFKSALT